MNVVKAAGHRVHAANKRLAEAIAGASEIAGKIPKSDLARLLDPSRHVGLSAELACVEAERAIKA
jgi:hypothetical protein